MMRCKMVLVSIHETKDSCGLVFEPVMSGSEENKNFFKWTPSGKIELLTINKSVADQFIPGQAYYVDFIAAE